MLNLRSQPPEVQNVLSELKGLSVQLALEQHRTPSQKVHTYLVHSCLRFTVHGLVDLGKSFHFSGPQFSPLGTGVLFLSCLLPSQDCPENQHEVTWKTPCNQHEWRLRAQALNQTLVQIRVLLLTSYMTFNKLLICPLPQVPHQRKETINSIFPIGLFWERKAQSLAHGQGSVSVGLITKLQASTCPRVTVVLFSSAFTDNRPGDNHASLVSEPPGRSYSSERKKEIHCGPEWGSREIQNELWSKSDFSPSLFLTSCELL